MNRRREYIETLSKEVGSLIWNGKYWGEDGALGKAWVVYSKRCTDGEEREASIEIASHHYGAINDALSRLSSIRKAKLPLLKKIKECVVWVIRAWEAYNVANIYSRRFEKLTKAADLTPSSDEYDVLGSIRGIIPWQRQKARYLYVRGLEQLEKEGKGSEHRALLLVKIGRCSGKKEGKEWVIRALAILPHDADPKISNRVYRDAGEFFCKQNHFLKGFDLLRHAERIAENANLDGALVKIRAIKNKYR